MSEEARKAAVFSCEYSEQNPVYCQQCGGHEHLCKKPLSDRWCEYANYLIVHGNDMTALSMRTNLLAEMNAHADHTAAIREKSLALLARLAKVFTDCEGLAYGRLLFTEKPYSELAVDFALSLFQWKDVAEGLPEVDGLYLVRYAGGPRGYYLEPFETTKSPNLQWTTVAAYIPHPIPPYEKEQSND